MKQAFVRSNDSLASLYEFAEGVFAANDVDDAARFAIHLALEELFVNMVKYNPEVKSDIDVEVSAEDSTVTVTLTEYGAPEFDVTVPKKVDIDAPLDERTPGGLGVYLIQNLTDSLKYEHSNGQSTIIFTKESGI
jgi:anti-sigma regulatory factor (Ser/Thr protein kinase)